MTKRPYVLPCILALMISSGAVAQERLTNAPGRVAEQQPLNLTGHFEIRPPKPPESAIDSSGGGGACLVAEIPANPAQSCNSSSDCSAGSYCLNDGGFSGPKGPAQKFSKTCWAQPPTTPGNDPCLKRIQGPKSFDTPKYDAIDFVKKSGATRWRVYACLNGPPGSCGKPGAFVEGVTVLHRAGPISQFRLMTKPLPLGIPAFWWIGIAFVALVVGLTVLIKRRTRIR